METLKTFKCPNCDGAVSYNNKQRKLVCEVCGGSFEYDAFDENKGWEVEADSWEGDEVVSYTCDSCGGSIIADRKTAATSCPFCGNPIVVSGNLSGGYKPKRIIPFEVSKKEAIKGFERHLIKKPFLPNDFKEAAKIEEVKAIYVPYWLFSGTVNLSMRYSATKITSTYRGGDYIYTQIGEYKLLRSGKATFDKIPVDGTKSIDDSLTRALEPFDYGKLIPFKDVVLSGYAANRYDFNSLDAQQIANQRMFNQTEDYLKITNRRYHNVIPIGKNAFVSQGSQEYVYLPVWLLNVKYNDKIYLFAMNGQTGKFVGDLPIHFGKSILYSLGFGSGVFAVVYVLLTLLIMGGL